MSISGITIATVNWYSVPFIRGLFSNAINHSYTDDIYFLICDNTNGQDPQISELTFPNLRIISNNPGANRMSNAHGLALNQLLSQIQTEYCLFVDPDCLIIKKNWDILLEKELNDSVVSIGAPYPPWKLGKYHDTPGPHFHFFKSKIYKELEVDWRPYSNSLLTSWYDRVARIILKSISISLCHKKDRSCYQIRFLKNLESMFGVISKDVGWKIPHLLKTYNYSIKLLDTALPSTKMKIETEKAHLYNELAHNFELYLWNQEPIVVHFYTTGNRASDKSDKHKKWTMLVEEITLTTETE